MKWNPGTGVASPEHSALVPRPTGRLSWRKLHDDWLAADLALKKGHSETWYKMQRHGLMPPKLDGRMDRMLGRITRNVILLSSVERHGSPDWIKQKASIHRARFQLADSIRTLRRHIRRTPDHPRGGLNGRTEEFSPMLREFLKGDMADVDFLRRAAWALRLLDRAANPGEEE